jgi:PGF-pre-PGF domain-containing protein
MNFRILPALLVLVAAAIAVGAPAGTQAEEIGQGVEIQPADGPNGQYAVIDETGEVSIDLTDANSPAGGGMGVNRDTRTEFDDVLLITNTNDQRAFVHVTDATDDISFYTLSEGQSSIEGQNNERFLQSGEQLSVGFEVDTTDVADSVEQLDATLTVVARVAELAEAALDISPDPAYINAGETAYINAGETITFDASGSTGEELIYDYNFSDGVVREDAAPQTERTFSDPGTYEVNLTVTETSGAGDDTSASVVREFVAVGEGSSEELDEESNVTIDQPEENSTEVVASVSIEFEEEINGTVTSDTVASKSIDDVTGESPDDEGIGATNIRVPSNEEDTNATVTLGVNRSDIPARVSPSELAIERYNDDINEWQTLPTSVNQTLTGPDIVSLEAETPGFSVVAVVIPEADGGGGIIRNSIPTPTPTPTPAETPTPTPDETPTPTLAETPTPTPAEAGPTATETDMPQAEPGGFDPIAVISVVGVLAALVAALLGRRYLSGQDE